MYQSPRKSLIPARKQLEKADTESKQAEKNRFALYSAEERKVERDRKMRRQGGRRGRKGERGRWREGGREETSWS